MANHTETIKEIFVFLRELQENNNRDWFMAQKLRYQVLKTDFEELVEELIAKVALWDEEVKGLKAKDCVYRIYRDVRFSPDKTPYKNHFAAYICGWRGRNSGRCGYYIHLEPGHSLLGGGCYCPEPALLKRLRQDIFDNIEEFVSILREPAFAAEFPEIGTEGKLKKVPAPFPADFPEAELLKRRNYDVLSLKSDEWFETENLTDRVDEVFRKMHKYNRFLNYTIDGEG